MRAAAVYSLLLWMGLAGFGRGENTRPISPAAAQSEVASDSTEARPDQDSAQLPAASKQTEPTADDALLTQKIAELERLQAEVQRLRHAAGRDQQIRIDVKICEVSVTKMRQSGVNLAGFQLDPAAPEPSPTTTGKAAGKLPAFVGLRFVDSKGVAAAVEMLRREKVLKLLAAPTLITTDGRPAYFLNGGEIPVPMIRADGSKGFSSRKIGTQVDLTATLLGGGQIRLNVRAGVVEVDSSLSITSNGVKVPGFRTREMDAPCEMELGTTAVLAGLVQEDMQVVVDAKTRRKSNVLETTQMLFLITPQLFAPTVE